MIHDRERFYSPLLFLLDCLGTFVAYVSCLSAYLRSITILPENLPGLRYLNLRYFYWDNNLHLLPLLVVAFTFFLRFTARAHSPGNNRTKDIVARTLLPCLFALIVFLCLLLVNNQLWADTWFVLSFIALLWLLLFANRVVVLWLIRISQRKGKPARYVLIVGTKASALEIAGLFDRRYEWGIRVAGLLTGSGDQIGATIGGYHVLGSVDDLFSVIEKHVVDGVIFTDEASNEKHMESLALRCRVVGIDFGVNVSALAKETGSIALEGTGRYSFIVFKPVARRPEALFFKRLLDVILSGIGITLCLPLWIILPILIKRDSPGPVFYTHERVGKNGRLFPMHKFRSMVVGADAMQGQVMHLNQMDGPVFKIRDDPRLTRIGRFLRRTSLDELPQLLNVFNGTMSLVGPRPPLMNEVLQYRPWQRKRLSVTPGITCLWQVTGRSEVKFDEWMRLDTQYIENWSLTLDVKILLKTMKAVIDRRGAL
jgi:exopolysaccharide biosynthesis polyprenyl glycosylphosphotransferase